MLQFSFNNLKRNFPKQPREAENVAVGGNCIQELITKKILQLILIFQGFFINIAETEEVTYQAGHLKGDVCN